MHEHPKHTPDVYNINESAVGTPLTLLRIPCIDFAGEEYMGTMRVHPAMAEATETFFGELKLLRFPIFAMQSGPWESQSQPTPNNAVPPRWFRLSNTLGYINKARMGKQSLSHHAVGLAFDLNPMLNPFVWPERNLLVPPFAVYNPAAKGTVTVEIAALAESLGFLWGGYWLEKKDYMHFSWADCESILPELKAERPGATFA